MARKIVVSLVEDPSAPSFFDRQILAQHDSAELAKELIGNSPTELFLILILNNKNKIIGHRIVANGGRNSCNVDLVVVFHAIISQMGSSFICAHNHPSGDPTPSSSDDAITRRLIMGADILGITLLDHIIIGENDNYYSYAVNNFDRAKILE